MTRNDFIEFIKNDFNTHYELINGEVKAMSTSGLHGVLVSSILGQFYQILKGSKCKVMPETFTIYIDEENNYAPDISIICDISNPMKGTIYNIIPELVVEVLSPSNDKKEIEIKIEGYYKLRVKEVWIVYNEYFCEIYSWTDVGYKKIFIIMEEDDELRIPFNKYKYDSEIIISLNDIPELWRTNPIYRYNIWKLRENDDLSE